MEQIEQLHPQSISYFFLRSKDVHMEDGKAFITFFARLTREVSFGKKGAIQTQVETAWVDIEEVVLEHASAKARSQPNCMQRFELTENVFRSLYQVSKRCPGELFHVTPYHRESTCEKFLS